MKYGGSSLMFWGYFTAKGLGHLVKVDDMMKKKQYIDILSHILKLGYYWTLMQVNDSKHTSNLVKT